MHCFHPLVTVQHKLHDPSKSVATFAGNVCVVTYIKAKQVTEVVSKEDEMCLSSWKAPPEFLQQLSVVAGRKMMKLPRQKLRRFFIKRVSKMVPYL